jgi:hypothetical protein
VLFQRNSLSWLARRANRESISDRWQVREPRALLSYRLAEAVALDLSLIL